MAPSIQTGTNYESILLIKVKKPTHTRKRMFVVQQHAIQNVCFNQQCIKFIIKYEKRR